MVEYLSMYLVLFSPQKRTLCGVEIHIDSNDCCKIGKSNYYGCTLSQEQHTITNINSITLRDMIKRKIMVFPLTQHRGTFHDYKKTVTNNGTTINFKKLRETWTTTIDVTDDNLYVHLMDTDNNIFDGTNWGTSKII